LKKKVIALIPARVGSKGIKNKNTKLLLGKPLLAWTIKTCLKSKYIDKIIVSTDSKRYADIALLNGAHEIIMRPKKISGDKSIDLEWIQHAISSIKNLDFEIIAHMRPTTPIRDVGEINEAIDLFLKSKFKSLRSIHEMPETAYKSFELKNNMLKPINKIDFTLDELNNSRQTLPKTYAANGVIDLYRKKFILKNKKLLGEKVKGYITNFTPEIDTIDDFKYIEYLMKKNDKN
jgi:N-acylneuraminate cytidylyltransferase